MTIPQEAQTIGKKMKISELMSALEIQVEEAKARQSTLEKAEAAQKKALEEYSASLSKLESMKTELTNAVTNIFPTGRVRQS